MAESRYKVKAVSAPFDTQYSSCSNIKPKKFDWSNTEGEWTVHIDQGILFQPLSPKEKSYGWFCESKEIFPELYSVILNNYKTLFNYYNKVFTCDKQLVDLDPRFSYCVSGSNFPWVSKDLWGTYNKKKLCSMFCSPKLITNGHKYRHKLAEIALGKRVDVFGGAHGTIRTVTDRFNPWKTKIDGLKDYMFSIVVENSIYDNYWTEKLTDCFVTGTIPIYWGTKNIPEVFDKNGIIWIQEGQEHQILNSLSEDLYLSKKQAVQNNFDAMQTMNLADDELFEVILNETN